VGARRGAHPAHAAGAANPFSTPQLSPRRWRGRGQNRSDIPFARGSEERGSGGSSPASSGTAGCRGTHYGGSDASHRLLACAQGGSALAQRHQATSAGDNCGTANWHRCPSPAPHARCGQGTACPQHRASPGSWSAEAPGVPEVAGTSQERDVRGEARGAWHPTPQGAGELWSPAAAPARDAPRLLLAAKRHLIPVSAESRGVQTAPTSPQTRAGARSGLWAVFRQICGPKGRTETPGARHDGRRQRSMARFGAAGSESVGSDSSPAQSCPRYCW